MIPSICLIFVCQYLAQSLDNFINLQDCLTYYYVKLLFQYNIYILQCFVWIWSLVLSSVLINRTLSSLCSVLKVGSCPVFNIGPNVLAIVCSHTQIRFHVFWSTISRSADLAAHCCRITQISTKLILSHAGTIFKHGQALESGVEKYRQLMQVICF